MLMIGVSGMVISLVALGGAFVGGGGSTVASVVAIVSLMTFVASFAISLGPIFWLLNAEIYPLGVRSKAAGLGTMANWTFNFIVSLTFLLLIEALGRAGAFWFYAAIGVLTLWFCWKYVPETKGKPLEEIEELFEERAGVEAATPAPLARPSRSAESPLARAPRRRYPSRMRVDEIIAGKRPTFSVQFSPPRTPEGEVALFETARQLRELEPDFVSVTYGAGGSTRDGTVEITRALKDDLGFETMAHLSCVGELPRAFRRPSTRSPRRGSRTSSPCVATRPVGRATSNSPRAGSAAPPT